MRKASRKKPHKAQFQTFPKPLNRHQQVLFPPSEAIADLVRDAVAKGALGFSTSRLLIHRDPAGVLTPGALAGVNELRAICNAVAEGGGGIFQMSTDLSTYEDGRQRQRETKTDNDNDDSHNDN